MQHPKTECAGSFCLCDDAAAPKLPPGQEESLFTFPTVTSCIISLVLPWLLQAAELLGQADENKGATQYCLVKNQPTNQHGNNLALLSFEQPFITLVPFPRTVSTEAFKSCSFTFPGNQLSSGAGWLSVCGGTKILGREIEGQITGDFYFGFGLFGFCYFSRDWSKALRSQTEMPAVPLEASGTFPMTLVGFESAPERVFQTIGIFQVTPWFLPCTTRPACHLHIFAFVQQVKVWGFFLLSETICC